MEALENPNISWRWKGWRTEVKELKQLTAGIAVFSTQELRGIVQTLARVFKKRPDV
ncbi:MAG: hypothetical protein ACP5GX_04175 [Anaerolineae bacterium]